MTNLSNHRAIIRAFYEEIWNKHDTSQIPELLHEDFSFRGSLGQEQHGHAGFAAYVDFVHAALSDYQCEIQDSPFAQILRGFKDCGQVSVTAEEHHGRDPDHAP